MLMQALSLPGIDSPRQRSFVLISPLSNGGQSLREEGLGWEFLTSLFSTNSVWAAWSAGS